MGYWLLSTYLRRYKISSQEGSIQNDSLFKEIHAFQRDTHHYSKSLYSGNYIVPWVSRMLISTNNTNKNIVPNFCVVSECGVSSRPSEWRAPPNSSASQSPTPTATSPTGLPRHTNRSGSKWSSGPGIPDWASARLLNLSTKPCSLWMDTWTTWGSRARDGPSLSGEPETPWGRRSVLLAGMTTKRKSKREHRKLDRRFS